MRIAWGTLERHSSRRLLCCTALLAAAAMAGCPGTSGDPDDAGELGDAGIVVDGGADADAGFSDAGQSDAGVPELDLVVTLEATTNTTVFVEAHQPACACGRSVWRLEACTLEDPTSPCACTGADCRPTLTLINGSGAQRSPQAGALDLLHASYFSAVPAELDPTLADDVSLVIEGCGPTQTVPLGRHALPVVTFDATPTDGGVTIDWASDQAVDVVVTAELQADTATYCPQPLPAASTSGSVTSALTRPAVVHLGVTTSTTAEHVVVVSSSSIFLSEQ